MAGEIQVYDYTVKMLEQLGRGAFGTVYKGFNKDQNAVAIKQVSKTDRKKASAEAVKFHYLKRKVSSEHIVEVHDVKTWKDSMWIMMEYCDFGDLNDYFQNYYQKLDAREKVNIMRQIAKGVAFLHIRDIVHRDIKPANILVKSTLDNNIIVKLGDFGLSKILDPNDETSSMSSDVGTLIFKAPEFYDKKDDRVRYHRSVDVYAAGLTFTAMLQAKPGHNLVPEVEGSLLSSETRMPIGLAAFTRCQNKHSEIKVVRTDKKSDTLLVRKLKMIIEKMTYFAAQARISATETDRRLNSLQGNESNAFLDNTANLSKALRMDPLLAEIQNLKQGNQSNTLLADTANPSEEFRMDPRLEELQKLKEELLEDIQNLEEEIQNRKEKNENNASPDDTANTSEAFRIYPRLEKLQKLKGELLGELQRLKEELQNLNEVLLEELQRLKEEIQNLKGRNESNALLEDTANPSEAFRMDPRLEELQDLKEELLKDIQNLEEEIQNRKIKNESNVSPDDTANSSKEFRIDPRLEELQKLKEDQFHFQDVDGIPNVLNENTAAVHLEKGHLSDALEDPPEEDAMAACLVRYDLPDALE